MIELSKWVKANWKGLFGILCLIIAAAGLVYQHCVIETQADDIKYLREQLAATREQ